MGKKQELQLRTWASELEKSTTIPFPSEPDVWYRMKLRVDVAGETRAPPAARSGRRTTPEPAEWTITLEDPIAGREGSPGIYGDSAADLY